MESISSPAILFLIFKRPDVTAQVFEVIRQAQPAKLYIAADGARTGKIEETEKVLKTRQIVLNGIDWPCEVKTLFRDTNLGCRMAVSSAIDWFFKHEEEGIILEDDCLPDLSFFRFCSELLSRYRNDNRVMAISGNNFQQGKSRTEYSYYFSRYAHCWGWATWKRAWVYWDGDLSSWPAIKEKKVLYDIFYGNKLLINHWENIFDRYYHGRIDSWNFPWLYSCWIQNGLTVLPDKNLVSNIGFGADATHTKKSSHKHSDIDRYRATFPLRHPFFVLQNKEADAFFEKDIVKHESGDNILCCMKKSFLRLFSFNENGVFALTEYEKERLSKFPRYTYVETTLFGVPVISNDSCTLLSDIKTIIKKEIYKFKAKKSNPLIIDCGANIGISVIFFKKAYPDATVIAFEPDPNLFKMLNTNIKNFSFRDIVLYQSAVWVDNFGVKFYSEGGHSGHIFTESSTGYDEKVIKVSSVRLRSVLDGFNHIDMLKIDIEGAEWSVLSDCNESIRKCDNIFVEYHSREKTPQNLHSILDFFHKKGYRYHITEAFARKRPFFEDNSMLDMDLQLNLFFYRNNE